MDSNLPRFVVGLGNPGDGYAHNRHNAGFMVVDALARDAGVKSWSTISLAQTCRAELEGQPLLLIKPLTFMNRCGESLRRLRIEHGIGSEDLLVVLDDLSLALGRLRIRERGSAGGHHGLESILQAMESDEILRLRLGIGEDQMPEDKAEFVLSDFPADMRPAVDEMIARACDAVRTIVRDGAAKAMAVFNA